MNRHFTSGDKSHASDRDNQRGDLVLNLARPLPTFQNNNSRGDRDTRQARESRYIVDLPALLLLPTLSFLPSAN
jgi:hypothetical protein